MKSARDEKVIEEIRQRILDAALEIIVAEGFNSFTMRRLATAIKMTAPNIYNYFSNKDEIYINIVIRGFRMLHAIIEAVYKNTADPFERIRLIAQKYVSFGIENPQYYEIMFVSSTPKYQDYIGTSFEALSEIEYKISMEIVALVMKAGYAFYDSVEISPEALCKMDMTSERAERKMVQLWSMLHGMVCLNNSRIMPYVLDDHDDVYPVILDDALKSLFREIQA